MEIGSVASLVGELRQCQLLDAPQLDEIRQTLEPRFQDPRALAGQLLKQGWLTPFQVNQLFQGRGGELVLGQYVLLERMGDSGMGQVYKARHRRMRRLVSLTVISEALLAQPDARERFYSEIQAASQLTHANILTAYDAGPIGRTHFFAMEYTDGVDLERLVREEGGLPVDQACELIRQAALGLQHAGQRGLLHHDLNPANLLFLRPGSTRDEAESPSGPSTHGHGLVKIRNLGVTFLRQPSHNPRQDGGARVGANGAASPDFVAPEQGMSPLISDVRSELYSLGCVFYYLLTARVPFAGGTAAEKLARHHGEAPTPVSAFRLDVPPEVEAVLLGLLAKDPAERYQAPIDVAQALEGILATHYPPAIHEAPPAAVDEQAAREYVTAEPCPGAVGAGYPVSSAVETSVLTRTPGPVSNLKRLARSRRWLLFNLVGAGVLLLGLGLFVSLLLRKDKPTVKTSEPSTVIEDRARVEFDRLCAEVKAAENNLGKADAVRPRLLEFLVANPGMRLKVVEQLSLLPSGLDALDPATISPAPAKFLPKELVAVLGNSAAAPAGPAPTLLNAWSQVALTRSGETLSFWNVMTGKQLLTIPKANTMPLYGYGIAPTGKLAAILTSDKPERTDRVLRIYDLEAGRERASMVTNQLNLQNPIVFSANGEKIAVTGSDQIVRVWDLGAVDKPPLSWGPLGYIPATFTFAPNGATATVIGNDSKLRIIDTSDGKEKASLVGNTWTALPPFYSANGQRVAVMGLNQENPAMARWCPRVVDAMTGAHVCWVGRETFQVAMSAWCCALSGDGNLLAVVGNDSKPGQTGQGQAIMLWDVAQNKERASARSSTPVVGNLHVLGFTPDNRWLAAWTQDDMVRIYDTGTAKELTVARGPATKACALAFSPLGQWIALGHQDGSVKLFDPATSKARPLLGKGHFQAVTALAFSPDGQLLASVSFDQRLIIWDMARKQVKSESTLTKGFGTSLVFLPDGQSLAIGNHAPFVTLWDLGTQKETVVLDGLTDWVRGVAVSPDGRQLAVTCEDYSAKWWSISNTRHKYEARGELGTETRSVAFSPDGVLVAMARRADPCLRFRALGNPTPRAQVVLKGPAMPMRSVAYAPDGRRVALVSEENQLLLVNTDSGVITDRWLLERPVREVQFANDARHAATIHEDGTCFVYRLPPVLSSPAQ